MSNGIFFETTSDRPISPQVIPSTMAQFWTKQLPLMLTVPCHHMKFSAELVKNKMVKKWRMGPYMVSCQETNVLMTNDTETGDYSPNMTILGQLISQRGSTLLPNRSSRTTRDNRSPTRPHASIPAANQNDPSIANV